MRKNGWTILTSIPSELSRKKNPYSPCTWNAVAILLRTVRKTNQDLPDRFMEAGL